MPKIRFIVSVFSTMPDINCNRLYALSVKSTMTGKSINILCDGFSISSSRRSLGVDTDGIHVVDNLPMDRFPSADLYLGYNQYCDFVTFDAIHSLEHN